MRKVILFGSAARSASTPASDVGLGVDLAVYTLEEARTRDVSLLRVAERTGRVMLDRP